MHRNAEHPYTVAILHIPSLGETASLGGLGAVPPAGLGHWSGGLGLLTYLT